MCRLVATTAMHGKLHKHIAIIEPIALCKKKKKVFSDILMPIGMHKGFVGRKFLTFLASAHYTKYKNYFRHEVQNGLEWFFFIMFFDCLDYVMKH